MRDVAVRQSVDWTLNRSVQATLNQRGGEGGEAVSHERYGTFTRCFKTWVTFRNLVLHLRV